MVLDIRCLISTTEYWKIFYRQLVSGSVTSGWQSLHSGWDEMQDNEVTVKIGALKMQSIRHISSIIISSNCGTSHKKVKMNWFKIKRWSDTWFSLWTKKPFFKIIHHLKTCLSCFFRRRTETCFWILWCVEPQGISCNLRQSGAKTFAP